MFKAKAVLISVIILFCAANIATAQSSAIDKGVSWIISNENADFSWGDLAAIESNRFVDTSEILSTTELLGFNATAYSNAINWLSGIVSDNNYLIAKRLITLSYSGGSSSDDLNALISAVNEDGGWGGDYGVQSTVVDTTFILLALHSVGYSDQTIIQGAINFLLTNQHSDGGWGRLISTCSGCNDGDDSNVYMTALVSTILQQFPQTTSVAAAVAKATAHLIVHQNADGGFGAPASTVFETAYAYMALISSGQGSALPLQNTIAYLKATQQANGSWNDDPYSTALALRALNWDINPPSLPTTGTVTGRVINGFSHALLSGVTVQLSAISGQPSATTTTDASGSFTLQDIPVGSQKILFSLTGFATSTATASITGGAAIDLGSISLSAAPTTGTISGTITDSGNNQPLSGVTVTAAGAYNGTATTVADGSFILSNVLPGAVTVTLSKTGYYTQTGTGSVTAGGHLFVNVKLSSTPPPPTTGNLSITSEDIAFSNAAPTVGETVTIICTVHNKGFITANNVAVDFFDGDPGLGGVLLGETVTPSIPANDSAAVSITWRVPTAATHKIFVVVDPLNAIDEQDKTDNKAYNNLTVATLPDLSIASSDITFSPIKPRAGDAVTVTAIIRNLGETGANNVTVEVYDGNPAAGGTGLYNMTAPFIGGGGSLTLQLTRTFNTGDHNIYVVIDRANSINESNKANNTATNICQIQAPLPAGQYPDFSLTSQDITYTPGAPLQGEIVTISAVVRNIGTLTGKNVTVQFSIYDEATGIPQVIGSRTVPAIDPGASATEEVIWIAPYKSGEYQVLVEIDPANSIAETDETNNKAQVPITVTAPVGPDLMTSSIDISGVVANAQTRAISGNIVVTIKNKGTQATSQPFVITAFEDRNNNMDFDPGSDNIIGQKTYSGQLNPGAEDTITIPVSGTVLFIDSPLYLKVDSGNAVTELDETNNTECLGIFTLCRHSNVNDAMKSGASWLIDHQLNVDAQGAMKAWAGSWALYYDALAVSAYKSTGRTIGSKYENVLKRLMQMQAPDGSWDESVYTTAYAIISLIYAGIDPGSSSITNAVAWLKRVQEADGSWGSAAETGSALTSLIKGDVSKMEASIQKAVQWLTSNQNSDGSWDLYPGTSGSINISVGTSPIIGLALATSPSDSRVTRAKNFYYPWRYNNESTRIEWLSMMLEVDPNNSEINSAATALLNLQMADGGWKYADGYSYSFFTITVDALNIFGKLGFSGAQIDKGVLWLENHINSNWDGDPIEKYVIYTNQPLNALQAAAIGDDNNKQTIVAGRKAIVNDQHSDGSWSEIFFETGVSRIFPAGESLFALKYYNNITTSEQTAINKAVNFLISAQLSDGGWPLQAGLTPSALNYSESALMALLESGLTQTNSTVSKGLSYLNANQRQNGSFGDTEPSARAAIIYKLAGQNYESRLSQTIAWIKANQNVDGGWGTSLGFTSTTTSTSWALIALSYAGETGIEVAEGVSWLLAAQNQDAGWGEVMGVPMSYGSSTAMAVWALSVSRFTLGFNLDLAPDYTAYCPNDVVRIVTTPDEPTKDISMSGSVTLQEGSSYPLSFSDIGASFESDFTVPSGALPGTATVHVTGIATYGNGAATSSFIVKNCVSLLPDLSISSSDVDVVSPVVEGQSVPITVAIHNLGSRGASNVVVAFFDGDPANGGVLIGSQTKLFMDAGATDSAEVTWNTFGQAGRNYIYVVVDPQNLIAESNENNNSTIVSVDVIPPSLPDLAIASSAISFSTLNPREGEFFTINADIHNLGLDASDIEVALYDGDPLRAGTLVNQQIISQIIPFGGMAMVSFQTQGISGLHNFYIVVDPDNKIEEVNETNNTAWNSLTIGPGLRLNISTDKAAYGANEDAIISFNITDNSTETKTISARVLIEDSNGAPVNEVATLSDLVFIAAPTVSTVATVTASRSITLSGAKLAGTSIVINNMEAVPLDGQTTWQCTWTLQPGANTLSIVSRNAEGYVSMPVTVTTSYLAPAAIWHMENNWLDSSGNGNDGTPSNGVTFSPSAKIGAYAGSFDGVNDYISVQNRPSLNFGSGDFSAEFWINVKNNLTANSEYGILNKNSAAQNSPGWAAEVSTWNQSSGQFAFVFFTTGLAWNGNALTAIYQMNTNTWYHIVAVRSGKTLNIYSNGILMSSKTNADIGASVDNTQPLIIGKNSWGLYLPALLDDVTIYNRALSATEIKANHDAASFVSQPAVPVVPPSQTINGLIFNTGSNYAGDYRAHVILYDGQTQEGDASTTFTILPQKSMDSKVATDKIAYGPNEQVMVMSQIQSTSPNYIFENLSEKITITDSQGTPVFTDTKSIPILIPGQLAELKTYWGTSTKPSGTYPVTAEFRDSTGSVIKTATASLVIGNISNPAVLLKGQISVDKQSALSSVPLTINYSVSNVGNIDLSDVHLSVLIVRAADNNVYDTLTDQASLVMGAKYLNAQVLGLQKYSAQDYLVILRANITGIEETIASTYFKVEGAPSAPSLYMPAQASDVQTLTPILIVNNASDPNADKLTYQFEIYSDAGLSVPVSVSNETITEGTNMTSWQVPVPLVENQIYYWRARAYDNELYGEWMVPASFRVNVENDPPTAPTLSAPADTAFVDTFTPVLSVNNASDPDSNNLTYNFEISQDQSFTNVLASATGIFEGVGTTLWQVPVTLQENTYYYWRVQADDWLTTGPWMTPAGFFVNTVNEAPSTPPIISPTNGTEITTQSADIVVSNSTDPDSPALTYLFEIDTTATFASPDLIRSGNISGGQGTTAFSVSGLRDNTTYCSRAKASDGSAESPWSDVSCFFVNTANDAPTAPILSNPSNGSGVNAVNPVLSVHNSTDLDRDVLTYEFEIYGDISLTNRTAGSSGIAETPDITAWTVPITLTENSIYYWRARAYDGKAYSDWSPTSSFMVNTANDAPSAPTINAPVSGSSIATLFPTLAVNNATDPDSNSLTYDFEIYAGGILIRTVSGIQQDASGTTSISLNAGLQDNTTYNWRARAYDGERYGAWMDMAAFSIHLPSSNITATIDFDPDTLNKKSNGSWVTVYIELPSGYDVANIDIASLRLEGIVPAEQWPYAIGDYDNDGIKDLMVKFKRNDVINILPNGNNVKVHVSGNAGASKFEGVDTIRVIK